MEICFAVFANVLELDEHGYPLNEKYAERLPPPGSTSTALGSYLPKKQTSPLGESSSI
ncbi:hypothetical protein B0E54_00051 [Micromonospora sp. MH99]|nr:hypothetical protein [Micromonospora sp. MH99]